MLSFSFVWCFFVNFGTFYPFHEAYLFWIKEKAQLILFGYEAKCRKIASNEKKTPKKSAEKPHRILKNFLFLFLRVLFF